MSFSLPSFWRSLTRRRHIDALTGLSERARSLFTPSDWLIAGACAVLMTGGALITLASVSLALSVEIPMRGGTHTEAVVGNPRFVNPLLALSDTDADLSALVFSGLMRENADGSLTPDLAERYEISADGKTYTFFISPKARFHDGASLTADDVVFTVKLAENPDIKSPKRANWDGVEVEKLDQHTVAFTLKSPYAPFLSNTTLGIIPEHLWASVKPEEFPFSDLNINAVGTGPYRVAKVVRDRSGVPTEMRLTAFDRAITVPHITHFIFRFYTDLEAVKAALTTGAADAAYGITQNGLKKKVHEAVYARIFGVFMNQSQNTIFADPAVRHALDVSLDKNDIVDKILGGYGTPLSGPLPTDIDEREPVPEGSIADARAILAADGWSLATSSADATKNVFTKKIKKSETRLAFTLTTANASELKGAAEAVASAWRELGVEVNVEYFDESDLTAQVLRPRKYDALLFGEVVGRDPDLYSFWDSSQRNDPGLNIALYTSSAVDKLLEAARTETDPSKREAGTRAAADTIAKERGAIFLYAPHLTYVAEPELRGINLTQVASPSDRFASVTDWYVETERVWPLFAD